MHKFRLLKYSNTTICVTFYSFKTCECNSLIIKLYCTDQLMLTIFLKFQNMASQATILHMPSVITTASSPESDEWSTYNLDWLYDPDRFDHLPIDKQLLLYKQRNLRKAKTFKLASTIWGTTYQRKRRFVLDSGNTPSIINSFSTKVESEITNFENLQTDTVPSSIVDETDESKYSKWIENRKNLRHGLENLVVNEQWLSSKHGRTPMEQRVLEYLRQTRKLKENKQETTVS